MEGLGYFYVKITENNCNKGMTFYCFCDKLFMICKRENQYADSKWFFVWKRKVLIGGA